MLYLKLFLPIIKNENNNWRIQGLSAETINNIKAVYSSSLSPFECACLFWYARNLLFLAQRLHQKSEKILLWKYEDLVRGPRTKFENLCDKIKMDLPKIREKIISDVSVSKKHSFSVNQDNLALCERTYSELNKINR